MREEASRQGQISIEYLIIIGVVLLLIVIPSAIFLTSFTQDTVTRTVNQDQIDRLGDGIVSISEHVYYLGLYSQRTSVLPITQDVEQIQSIHIEEGAKKYYYIRVITRKGSDEESHYYQTRAPVYADDNSVDLTDVSECDDAICTGYRILGNPGRGERTFNSIHTNEGVKIIV